MEFTCDGMVRYGFGFANPNHAAALICAVLPFVWLLLLQKKYVVKFLGGGLSVGLLIALALTYSRAGLVVFLFEAVMFGVCFRKMRLVLGVGGVFVLAYLSVRGFVRLSVDAAMMNRLDIARGGLILWAHNPWGVGLGQSGLISSAYLLPEGMSCRTLVNSPLTFLVECGGWLAWLIGGALLYAILRPITALRKRVGELGERSMPPLRTVAWIALCGLVLSSCFASIVDMEVLVRPQLYAHFSTLNFFCAYSLAVVCLGLFLYLLWERIQGWVLALGYIVMGILLGGLWFLGQQLSLNQKVPLYFSEERIDYLQIGDSPSAVVYFDDSWSLDQVKKTFSRFHSSRNIDVSEEHKPGYKESESEHEGRDGYNQVSSHEQVFPTEYIVALHSMQSQDFIALPQAYRGIYTVSGESVREVYLFGKVADFAHNFPESTQINLISPSPHYRPDHPGIRAIYLNTSDPRYKRLMREKHSIIYPL